MHMCLQGYNPSELHRMIITCGQLFLQSVTYQLESWPRGRKGYLLSYFAPVLG